MCSLHSHLGTRRAVGSRHVEVRGGKPGPRGQHQSLGIPSTQGSRSQGRTRRACLVERRAVRRPHPPRRPSSAGVQLTGREPQQRQMTHLRHCLASLRVEPSANCFMLKSVPPAEPSLQSPWKKRQEPVLALGDGRRAGLLHTWRRLPPWHSATLSGDYAPPARLPPRAFRSKMIYWGGRMMWPLVRGRHTGHCAVRPDLSWDLLCSCPCHTKTSALLVELRRVWGEDRYLSQGQAPYGM